MLVYRLSLTQFAKDMTGEGARLFGGRWNEPGHACIYTSESRALAILEFTANVPEIEIPVELSIVSFNLPSKTLAVVTGDDLPANWNNIPATPEPQKFGTEWLIQSKQLALKLPSVIVPTECNIIINPLHPDIGNLTIEDITPYSFDRRIKR